MSTLSTEQETTGLPRCLHSAAEAEQQLDRILQAIGNLSTANDEKMVA